MVSCHSVYRSNFILSLFYFLSLVIFLQLHLNFPIFSSRFRTRTHTFTPHQYQPFLHIYIHPIFTQFAHFSHFILTNPTNHYTISNNSVSSSHSLTQQPHISHTQTHYFSTFSLFHRPHFIHSRYSNLYILLFYSTNLII